MFNCKRLRLYTLFSFLKVRTFAVVISNNRFMTAVERYEKAWDSFLIHLNRNSKARLTPFLRERHVNIRMMQRWMADKGYSVIRAKQEIRRAQSEARKQEREASDTGMLFLPVESAPAQAPFCADMLSGINVTFPNGTQLNIKKGSAKSVMQLMRLYEREDLLCLD